MRAGESVSPPRRPVLAVVFGDQSAPAMSIADAASSVCDVLWVVNSDEMADASALRLLRRLGTIVDLAGLTFPESVDAVRAGAPAGIVAYADAHLALASALGAALGLECNDAEVTERLLDKVAQRRAFEAAGIAVPRCVPLSPEMTAAQLDEAISSVAFPVVLKPRHGAASRDTDLAPDEGRLRDLLEGLRRAGPPPEMVMEEYLVGAVPPPSDYFGDFVSVESVVERGRVTHLALTGRTPWVKPFRETGLIIPSDFEPSLAAEVLELATACIAALGIRWGCLHTEIKVTGSGPRVMEVNGRIGGFVAPVLALASPGVDFYEISQRVALGLPTGVEAPLRFEGVGYVIVAQPPIGAHRVVEVSGLDELAELAHVSVVSLNRRPGDPVDWRLGSHEYVYSVLGNAPDHAGVRAVQEFIDENVVVTYA